MCKFETKMMTEGVKSREVKEKEDEKIKKLKATVAMHSFNMTYDENGTQSFNPNRG